MAAVIKGITDVTSVLTTVFTAMTANTYCLFLLAAGALGVGIGVFRKVKKAAR